MDAVIDGYAVLEVIGMAQATSLIAFHAWILLALSSAIFQPGDIRILFANSLLVRRTRTRFTRSRCKDKAEVAICTSRTAGALDHRGNHSRYCCGHVAGH